MKNLLTYKAELTEMKRLVEEEGKSIEEARLERYKVSETTLQEYYADLEMELGNIYHPKGLYDGWHKYRKA